MPEGESAPDAGTKSESATGAPADVASDDSEAEETTAEGAVERTGSSAEVIETRQGMFGVHGTGDTSGYGGLTRTIEFPAPRCRRTVGGGTRSTTGSVELVPATPT